MRTSAAAAARQFALAACAGAPRAEVPDQLKSGSNESLAMIVAAKGVQIYECRPRKDAAVFEWAFVAPEAQLFDRAGKPIGRHGAGPAWEAADGSRVVATLKQRADAPNPGAIPWLLLAAQSAGPAGAFSGITSIQRVNTAGGLAPATGCDRDTVGSKARVDYTADYHFHRRSS